MEMGALSDLPALAVPVCAFYLIVFCNFTKEVAGCRLQQLLDGSMAAKHAVGFLLLLFLVVLANPANADVALLRNVGVAAAAYALFLMTTRSPLPLMLAVLALLFAVYVLGATKDRCAREHKEDQARKVHKAQLALTATTFALAAVGFGMYFVEKRREYGPRFSLAKFVAGRSKCRGYTPSGARLM